MERNPTRVPAHYLQHKHSLMAGGRRVQAIERVGRTVDGAIEPECKRRRQEVVVDRLRHADDRNPKLMKLLGDRERAVTADANEAVEAQLVDRRLNTFEQLAFKLLPILHADRRGEPAFVRRTENRAALVENARRVLRRKCAVLYRIVQALISLEETDALVTEPPAGFRSAADDRIQSGAIAPARKDANSLLVHGCSSFEV